MNYKVLEFWHRNGAIAGEIQCRILTLFSNTMANIQIDFLTARIFYWWQNTGRENTQ
jgi:hypothetical protein